MHKFINFMDMQQEKEHELRGLYLCVSVNYA